MDLTIQADPEYDLLRLSLSKRALEKRSSARTLRIDEDIALDFDAEGRLLGIDIMNASERLGTNIDEVTLDALVGVKEAAKVVGVRPPNFVRDYADKPDFPRPVVELAGGRIWLRSQVEAYARARKRRAS